MKRIYARIILKIIPATCSKQRDYFSLCLYQKLFSITYQKNNPVFEEIYQFQIFLFKHACTV